MFLCFFEGVQRKRRLSSSCVERLRQLSPFCPRRGEFERCVGRVGNLNRIYLLFRRNTPVSFFFFGLQGMTDLQDKISPLLVNNSFKRVFKDGASFCYCAYVLRISGYSGFLRNLPPNTTIFLRGLYLRGKSRS